MVNKKYVGIAVIALFFVIVMLSASLVLSTSKTHVTSNSNTGSVDMGNNSIDTNNSSEVTVLIQNGTFHPSNLTVKSGTTVLWINNDSDVKYMVTGSGFMSPHLTKGQNFSYTFNKAGNYAYYDMDHMDDKKLTGTVVVK